MDRLALFAASNSSFWHEALPFAFALGYVILSPLMADLTWRSTYREFYRSFEDGLGLIGPDELAKGASWAVDLSQVVPGVLLTTCGILLASSKVTPEIAAVCVAATILPFAFVAAIRRRGHLHDRDADWRLGEYSSPQIVLAIINVIAITILTV
jgi:hypothetical protein